MTHPHTRVVRLFLRTKLISACAAKERRRECAKVRPLDHQSDYSLSVMLQCVGYWHQQK